MNHSLAHVGLRVTDVAASVEHVRAVLGVDVASTDGDTVRMALPGQPVSVILIGADEPSCDHMALRTHERNLVEITERARAAGVTVQNGDFLGGDSIRVVAPNGLAVEIGPGEAVPRNTVERSVGPVIGAVDHLSLTARDLDGTVAFFSDVLGFRISDSVGDQRRWLRCGPNHHTVAVFHGEDGLHHYAFEASGIDQLQRLGDLLATRGQNFLWGPGRHGLGANIFTYHQDPAGAILEVCCEMIQVDDEEAWVAQTWPPDTPASAVMWGPMPPPEFRTLAIPILSHLEQV